MSAETDRLDALESWVDSVTPTLRALARRALAMPDKDQAGADAGLLGSLDDATERPAVIAAVPLR